LPGTSNQKAIVTKPGLDNCSICDEDKVAACAGMIIISALRKMIVFIIFSYQLSVIN
jgi:hypothetical protein